MYAFVTHLIQLTLCRKEQSLFYDKSQVGHSCSFVEKAISHEFNYYVMI